MQQENKTFSDTFCRYSTIIYSLPFMFFVLQKSSLFHGVNNKETVNFIIANLFVFVSKTIFLSTAYFFYSIFFVIFKKDMIIAVW